MINISNILQKIKDKGFQLYLEQDNRIFLSSKDPDIKPNEHQKTFLRQYKQELIRHFQQEKTWLKIIKSIRDSSSPQYLINAYPKIGEFLWTEYREEVSRIEKHVSKFIEYDYSFLEIFGCHQIHPWTRIDYMGAALLVNATRYMKEVRKESILYQTASRAIQSQLRCNMTPKTDSVIITNFLNE